ncbi:hypothetical protein PR202_gb12016 [Eleusine coracana subsp. coracana]|uniref:BURP domain-containing protein n=1 Tax=Eleusine coracana subsp. coracana TaxID=191504 RepID=A0AAV5ELQ7_ELECO|nr:hypothetical protein QOZ80_7BG0584030 [Eleusine coracana subsp. coracana]GJN24283.1 hypothetical protein PR202_gb12016 [Eleusine coracana subsp. coracana]
MENFLFTEEVLTHGTIIAPCIKPSTSPAPFLRHEIANSISLTIKNFPNILEMFAPKSHALASDIWSNIRSCENIHLAENQTCATSMNSMIMFVTSVLGTRNLQAFSSSEVPVEGISSGSQRYMVVAARRVTTSRSKMEETTMTCHGVEFPFAVFYCHTENPTRIYEVNLENQEDAQTKTTMRALVVCHLDTSKFDPKIPFFAKRHIKPGDVPLCHFLERGGILWAPAAASAQDDGISIAR